jgi:GMP reductase
MVQVIQEIKLDFNDVMLRPMTSSLNSRAEVLMERTFTFKNSPKTWTGVPIIAANMDTVGTIGMAKVLQKHKIITALHKFYSVKELAENIPFSKTVAEGDLDLNYVAFSTGIRTEDFKRLEEFKKSELPNYIHFICIDVPNGYIPAFFEGCKKIRQMFPDHILMAGNVVTADVTERLIQDCGIDIVKVGIGPGEACTTRALTGVGYPQLSAVMETANAAHGLRGHIVSDGGCRTPGDVAKAFAGGADFVMLGGMLAGHDESGGEVIEKDGQKFVKFYGMSSAEAMEKHYGGVASHRAPEGRSILKPYKGPAEKTVLEILGGVRSSATYIGAETIKQMHKRATFVRLK